MAFIQTYTAFIHALMHAVTRVGARPHQSILGMGPSAIPALCTRPPHPRYAPRYGPAMLLAADSGSEDCTQSNLTEQTKEQHRPCCSTLTVSRLDRVPAAHTFNSTAPTASRPATHQPLQHRCREATWSTMTMPIYRSKVRWI
ncbi:hypothetical protein BC628DRAFT_1353736 [Trametes gibbosa]|nr:hypothetical protein BC628DRAFT_1353736 [Trametes gibbosa]